MNILFALYHDFTANSAIHVHALANELSVLGNECCVAVPFNKGSVAALGPAQFTELEFEEVFQQDSLFSNGHGPDIVHAWTPREIVRKFCEQLLQVHQCRLFIHLEDNEWHLLSCFLGEPFQKIASLPAHELDAKVPPTLSHPQRGVDFLKSATGITVIIDRLRELAPPEKLVLELWPAARRDLFGPRPKQPVQKRIAGLPENVTVLVYTGNVHYANAHEVRSLYLAVAILNREGHPTAIVRTGRDFFPFLGPEENWARRYSSELGIVPYEAIPDVLALADILVQPGSPDEFNDYRFPSKLPEFLSIGRPLVLPNTNVARRMKHRQHGFILAKSNAVSIATAVREIMSDRALYDSLSKGALAFSEEHLSWEKSAKKLETFYRETAQMFKALSRSAHSAIP
ncbi:MAG: hypothetical protein JO097_00750 [Acidobacteriaceae bacterium]|nr:hypothetical protein [Acidobacteriaceae bacterium]MBV9302590.1 hypothetical protein [Acidobacteriaceae bacterium]MBV9767233.1 hypothetical protein [Acidobacteriaceae bacterium]